METPLFTQHLSSEFNGALLFILQFKTFSFLAEKRSGIIWPQEQYPTHEDVNFAAKPAIWHARYFHKAILIKLLYLNLIYFFLKYSIAIPLKGIGLNLIHIKIWKAMYERVALFGKLILNAVVFKFIHRTYQQAKI